MSEKLNRYLPTGIIMLLIFGLVIGAYYIQEVKTQSVENSNQISQINKTVTGFIDQWQTRVKIGNSVNNNTQGKIINLTTDLQHTESDILGNLTKHRMVANQTRDLTLNMTSNMLGNQKQIIDLQYKIYHLLQGNQTELMKK